MEAYHSMTPDYIRWELNGAEGWAYYNWARQNKASVWGTGERLTTPGYMRQQIMETMRANGR